MEIRLQAADTIIFLDLSKWVCLYHVLKRRFQYRNKTRMDMAEGCEERISLKFLKWVWEYPKKQKPNIVEKLSRLSKEKHKILLTCNVGEDAWYEIRRFKISPERLFVLTILQTLKLLS